MPIAYVGSNSVLNSTSGTSTAVPMPTGLAVGNMIFVMIASVGSSPSPTAPAGWTLVSSFTPGTTLTTYLYRKVATTGDIGVTYTWTWSSGGRNLGASVAYSGIDPAVTTTTAQVWTHDVANAPIVAPSLASGTGDWVATVGVGKENPGTATAKDWSTETATDSQRLDIATAGAATDVKLSLGWFDSNGPLSGGSTSRIADVTPQQQQSHVWSILLGLPVAEAYGTNPWTHMGFGGAFLSSGALSAGLDTVLTTADTFTRTASEPASPTPSARKWEIISGPLGTGTQIGSAAALSWKPGSSVAGSTDIRQPTFQELAYEITSTAENSTLDWTSAYGYIEDINDNRGYTGGLVGFTSGTGDMLQMVQQYAVEQPGNALAGYISKLQECATVGMGTGASSAASTKLGTPFINAWKAAATNDPIFRKVQRDFRKSMYWNDALAQALADGVGPLGLCIYYDVLVNHGVGTDSESFGGILTYVRANNTKPSSGGNQTTWLNALINRRDTILKGWGDDQSVSGRVFMHKLLVNGGTVDGASQAANLNLTTPFKFTCYGDLYTISARPDPAADALLGAYVLRYTATGVGTSDVTVTVGSGSGSTGTLSAGANATLTTSQTFTRTATEPSSPTPTARMWEIVSGPLGAGMQIGSAAALSWKPGSSVAGSTDIRNPTFQELAFEMTSTAENSTLDWTSAYGYIEDINDQRGYTAGLVGFCSATGDMLQMVQQYVTEKPTGNTLASYVTKLQECAAVGYGTGASSAASTKLGTAFINAWKAAATNDPIFRKVQRDFRKSMYWDDALAQALADGVCPLGLAIYYDVLVNHGVGTNSESFGGILTYVRANNTKPSAGGNMTTWLLAVINRRDTILKGWGDDQSVSGRVFMHKLLVNGGTVSGTTQGPQLNLVAPFKWTCYGDPYSITARPDPLPDALLGSYVLRYTATGVGTSDVTVTVS